MVHCQWVVWCSGALPVGGAVQWYIASGWGGAVVHSVWGSAVVHCQWVGRCSGTWIVVGAVQQYMASGWGSAVVYGECLWQ